MRLIVLQDIIALFIQGSGGGIAASANDLKTGQLVNIHPVDFNAGC